MSSTPPTGPAHPALARVINDRTTLDLLAARGPLSRTDLRDATGLSQPTVLEVINRLTAAGLVQHAGEGSIRRRGPRSQLFAVDPGHGRVGALAVDGIRITATIADIMGTPLGQAERPVDRSAAPVDQLVAALTEAGAGSPLTQLAAVTVGTHGYVDRRTGDLAYAWDLPGWENRVATQLRERLGIPTILETDVFLAALAELEAGTASGRTFGALWIGTGVGFAFLDDGQPLRGATGGAGQVGYMPMPGADTPVLDSTHDPTVGYPGGLQSLLGADAVHRLAGDYGLIARPQDARHSRGLRAAELLLDARRTAPQLLTRYADSVALALAGISAVVDPGDVVLTGSIGHAAGDVLAPLIQDRLQRISPVPAKVHRGCYGRESVLIGALELAVTLGRDSLWGTA